MANDYIKLGGFKMLVIPDNFLPEKGASQVEVKIGLDGDVSRSTGVFKKTPTLTVLLKYSTPDAGFGVLSDLETMYKATTSAGMLLSYEDVAGSAPYNVMLGTGSFEPTLVGIVPYSTNSYWSVPLQLIRV